MNKLIVAALLAMFTCGAVADVFVWTNRFGSTEIWGCPPAWYRNNSTKNAPRTQVFINGRLIDDTTRQLPDSENTKLRMAALERCRATEQAAAPHQGSSEARSKEEIGREIEGLTRLPKTQGVHVVPRQKNDR